MKKILITMGDPSGVGPEISVKYFKWYFENIQDMDFIPILVGSRTVFEETSKNMGCFFDFIELNDKVVGQIFEKTDKLCIINIKTKQKIESGVVSKNSGALSMEYLETALEIVKSKKADALVTCPISKEAINLAGYDYSGHTEYLAEKTQTKDFGMVLKGKKVTVILNSTHVSLIDAISKVKKEIIIKKIKLAEIAKNELGLTGKIAVAGLNPHNGENGLFGDEESKEIEPAVEEAKKRGIDCEGPVVPDTLFVKMLQGKYSLAVVMYHDQGLIPMKMESFGMGVNITIGLPIIRTSVDHGTAFDIAGKGIADFGSLKEAVNAASTIIDRKNKN